jgi:hypothetical protein
MRPPSFVGKQASRKFDPAQVVEVLSADELTATVLIGRTAKRITRASGPGALREGDLPKRQDRAVVCIEGIQ